MDEEDSAGSQDDTEKVKEETESVEEAIKRGMAKASDTSVQSQEETVSSLPQLMGGVDK